MSQGSPGVGPQCTPSSQSSVHYIFCHINYQSTTEALNGKDVTHVSTLEEEHLASEHPVHGAPVEGGGGPALSHLVAVVVLGRDLSSPFGILSRAALNVKGEAVLGLLGCQGRGVVLHVDLHVLSQLADLLEDAGEVAHGVRLVVSVVLDLLEELVEIILIHIDQALAGVSLCSPQGLEV